MIIILTGKNAERNETRKTKKHVIKRKCLLGIALAKRYDKYIESNILFHFSFIVISII